LERVDTRRVLRVDREHQAIEEAAAFGCRSVEQTIHRWNEPRDADMVGKSRGGADRLAIDAAEPAYGAIAVGGRFDACAQRHKPERALNLNGHGPRPGARAAVLTVSLAKRHLLQRRTSQAASRREKRDGLEKIGLAGAVRADEHDQAVLDRH